MQTQNNLLVQNEVLDYFKSCMESDEEDENNYEYCLITGDKLNEHNITLACGHKFNYIPLFNEVCKQKCIINHREIFKTPYRCIKCPYCRNLNNGILPYRETVEPKKIDGVNWPLKYSIMNNSCEYIFRSGKKKGIKCENKCIDKYCTTHQTIAIKMEEKNKNIPEIDSKQKCSYYIQTKNGKRLCKKYSKENGLCSIHLKMNEKNNVCQVI